MDPAEIDKGQNTYLLHFKIPTVIATSLVSM